MLADSKKISIRQAFFIFLTVTFTPSIRLIPIYAAKRAKQAAWLSPVITVVLFFLLALVWQTLYRKFKDHSLMDIYSMIAGKYIGKILVAIHFAYIVLLTVLYIRYFGIRLAGAIYPNMSLSIFIISMLAIVTYALYFGLTAFARLNEIILPFIVIVFFVLIIMMLPNVKFHFLTPITYRSILPILSASAGSTGIVAYFTFMFIFGERINNKESIRKTGLKVAVFLLIAEVMIIASSLGIFSYSVAQRTQLPFLIAVKQISALNVFEKVEAVVVAVWVTSDFVLISFFIFCGLSILKSLFKLTDTKPLIIIYVILSYILSSLLANNIFEMERLSEVFYIPGNIILGFVLPVVMLIVGKLRKKV